MYLPLYIVTDTPSHIQGDDITCVILYVLGTVEATLHLFSRGESGSLVHSWLWSVTDNSSSGAKAHIQSVICCPTLPHVAASAGSAVKVYDIR